MGQEESVPSGSGSGGQRAAASNDPRFTVRTVAIENRIININKEQYKFKKELGAGAFGAVYSSRHIASGKMMAIKVVSLVTLSSVEAEALAESILTEIEMSKRLSGVSKNIVHMFDFDFHRHTGLAFLVMDLGEKDLEKSLNERSRLSPAERKEIWRQLVNIAVVLHDNKIVHLDIKPQNLVMFPHNRVKLVDLGIAQKSYQRRVGSNGTWFYSAPEVTNIPRNRVTTHTSKADAWSWGAVLYRVTYLTAPTYTPPCHHPPKDQSTSRDANLVDVLRYTLVLDPKERADAHWLARHAYTLSAQSNSSQTSTSST